MINYKEREHLLWQWQGYSYELQRKKKSSGGDLDLGISLQYSAFHMLIKRSGSYSWNVFFFFYFLTLTVMHLPIHVDIDVVKSMKHKPCKQLKKTKHKILWRNQSIPPPFTLLSGEVFKLISRCSSVIHSKGCCRRRCWLHNALIHQDFAFSKRTSYSPPKLISAGHQWTMSTNVDYIQWLSLAKPTLKVAYVGTNCSMMVCTNKRGRVVSHTIDTPDFHLVHK